jgi:hypothetical protein
MTGVVAQPDYAQQAAEGIARLQHLYLESTGLYEKPTDWWNAANAVTLLVDYSRTAHSNQYVPAIANTFHKANLAYGTTNFTNDSNDDAGWWAVAWIDAYDLTRNRDYLTMAEAIFSDMASQWEDKTCGGGVWWSKDLKHSAYKNAITNELFLEIAASLANREEDKEKRTHYLAWAQKEWAWFRGSGMINSQSLVNDGLNARDPAGCGNNGGTTWTYNQGVILGGLAELYKADADLTLLQIAHSIAEATITTLVTPGGVLKEPRGTGPDLPQFKGIFMRNLAFLNSVAPKEQYRIFILANAESIVRKDQGPEHQFGLAWEGPFDSGDGTRQTSALSAVVAAMQLLKE